MSLCVFSPGDWAADDLHAVSSRLHQSVIWQPDGDDCPQISVFSGVSDVPAALSAADWSQASLRAQPAVLPGSHADQVTRLKAASQLSCQSSAVSWLLPADRTHQWY